MKKSELVSAVANAAGLSRSQASRAVDAVFGTVVRAVESEGEVRLAGGRVLAIPRRRVEKAEHRRIQEVAEAPPCGASVMAPAFAESITEAFGEATKAAVRAHRQVGRPVFGWIDGKLAEVPAPEKR